MAGGGDWAGGGGGGPGGGGGGADALPGGGFMWTMHPPSPRDAVTITNNTCTNLSFMGSSLVDRWTEARLAR